jgi:hypothetical protein
MDHLDRFDTLPRPDLEDTNHIFAAAVNWIIVLSTVGALILALLYQFYQAKKPKCSGAACIAEATHFCTTVCGFLCAECEKAAHPPHSDHLRGSIAELLRYIVRRAQSKFTLAAQSHVASRLLAQRVCITLHTVSDTW